MTVQANIESYTVAMDAVAEYCMAARVVRDGGKVTIYYPDGYYPSGCRVDDSAKGLTQALSVMERHWLESFPSGNGMN